MAQPFAMPSRRHHSAPIFDGTPADLPIFFEDFEDLARRASLTDEEKIIQSTRYVSSDLSDLWRTIPEYEAVPKNWANFKEAIMKLYPRADRKNKRRYNVCDLEAVTEARLSDPVTNVDQLAAYYRAFLPISSFLKTNQLITDREISQTFLRGFSADLRAKIWDRLLSNDKSLYQGDAVPLQDAYDAADHLLHGREGYTGRSLTTSAPLPKEEVVKPEPVDMKSLTTSISQAVAAAVRESFLQIQQMQQNNLQSMAPPMTAPQNPRPYSTNCMFCGLSGHHVNSCPRADDYINAGKCKRVNGRLQLPNGTELGRYLLGQNFQQKIDNWFNANPNAPTIPVQEQNRGAHPRATVGMWQVLEPSVSQYQWATDSRIEEVPDEDAAGLERSVEDQEDDAILAAAQAVTEKRMTRSATKNVRFEETANRPFTGNPANRPAPSTTPTSPAPASKSIAPKPAAPSIPKVTPPTILPSSTNSSSTQYSFKTPVEDSKRTQELYEMIMNTPISGVTPRHILAAAPDVRKLMKEDTTTRKVPTTTTASVNFSTNDNTVVEAFLQEADIAKYLSRPIETLRSVSMLINDDFHAECILDSGCQIVVIRKDVWQRTRLPLNGTESILMESANTNKDSTLGMIRAIKMTLGDMTYYIHCQVVHDAAFEILLGRPFHVIAQAATKDFSNGDQNITIFDPVTGAQQTIPTHERIRRASPHQGF